MDEKWYYVKDGARQGPVSLGELQQLVSKGNITGQDYVWCRQFENWKRVKEVSELAAEPQRPASPTPNRSEEQSSQTTKLSKTPEAQKAWFIRIGPDRGETATDYGPFDRATLKKLYEENRINGKTLVYGPGLSAWIPLADIEDYQEVFSDMPPVIDESERRRFIRRPFVARMLIHDKNNVYEGVCRDISVGGMQVLVSDFPSRVGDDITINVHPDNTDYHFVSSGKIVRALEANQGFSFRFSDLSPEAKNAIETYLQKES